MQPKLILSPIDFSDHSQQALNAAVVIASKFGSEICLAHVVPAVPDLPESVSILKEREYEDSLSAEAKTKLEEMARQIEARGVHARTVVGKANDVAMELIRLSETEKADLVVIATHGMTGWRPLVFGSVADKVVRDGTCAVLLLRAMAASKSKVSGEMAAAS
jgi:nucleotide-binding universal stress UspA family protein